MWCWKAKERVARAIGRGELFGCWIITIPSAAVIHETSRTGLGVPVTFLSTSLLCKTQVAATASMKLTRVSTGRIGSRLSMTRCWQAFGCVQFKICSLHFSSCLVRGQQFCPSNNDPQDSIPRFGSCWTTLFNKLRRGLDPTVRLHHYAYSYTIAKCTFQVLERLAVRGLQELDVWWITHHVPWGFR